MKHLLWLIPAGMLAWLTVPNFLVARNRSMEKRTMANIRSIATAWEARATNLNTYAVISHNGDVSATELARALEPTYIRQMPRLDGWDNELQFSAGADTYSIRSLGSDSRADRDLKPKGAMQHFQDDIVYENGSFVQYPEGAG